MHMSVSLSYGVSGFERLPALKYHNVQKWERRFTLGLDAAKNTHYIKNATTKSG